MDHLQLGGSLNRKSRDFARSWMLRGCRRLPDRAWDCSSAPIEQVFYQSSFCAGWSEQSWRFRRKRPGV